MTVTLMTKITTLGLVCPNCRSALESEDENHVHCAQCGDPYACRGQVIDLLPKKAAHVEDEHALFELMTSPATSDPGQQWARSKQSFETTVKSIIGSGSGLTIAHVGCGVDAFANSFEDAKAYVSLDVTLAMLERTAFDHSENKTLVRADVSRLPFGDDALDVVLCIDLIHHFASRGIAVPIAELFRCLRPGGLLFLEEINRYALYRLPIAWAPPPVLRQLRRVKHRFSQHGNMPAPYEAPLSLHQIHQVVGDLARGSSFSVALRDIFPCLEYPEANSRGRQAFANLAAHLPFVATHLGYHWFVLLTKQAEAGQAQP